MATETRTQLTYDDLQAFPEDNLRRELIDGELIVTAAPGGSHQDVALRLGAALLKHAEHHGGHAYMAPRDVYLDDANVVEPDVLFLREEHLDRIEERVVRGAPDIVVEVSSPSTRRLELVRKRGLYARFGVPEYWYVDLQAEEVYIDRLVKGSYTKSRTLSRGEVLESPEIPGFAIEIDYLLGPRP